jgi:hypothetical protein
MISILNHSFVAEKVDFDGMKSIVARIQSNIETIAI